MGGKPAMPHPHESQRFEALKKLASERYGTISEHEMRVLERSASSDNANVSDTSERPEVRSDFLRWLATDLGALRQIDPFGIRVCNATVSSFLDLTYCKIPFALEFRFCALKGGMSLRWANIPHLYLFHCTTDSGIWADRVMVSGDITLETFSSSGTISLQGAEIGGKITCSGAKLTATGDALNARAASDKKVLFEVRNGRSWDRQSLARAPSDEEIGTPTRSPS